MIQDQIYYVKWIDTGAKPNTKGYVLKYDLKEGEDIYYDAKFTTQGFSFKTPKIQVRDTPALTVNLCEYPADNRRLRHPCS